MAKKKKKRMGRPPLPAAARRAVKVSLRMTHALHAAASKAARQQGVTISGYIHNLIVEAVKGNSDGKRR